ncbi:MAG: hypothetical protein ACLQOO_36855 [Terriglobia bacterium]
MRAKVIVAQVVIVAGLVVWLKVCMPRMEKARAAAEVVEREKKIEMVYQSMVVEDTSREVQTPEAKGPAHPLRLRSIAPVDKVEQALGVPDSQQRDFRGGMHLTWTGNHHTLEASFDSGRLYCLTITDRKTGHGSMVFESSLYWHPF